MVLIYFLSLPFLVFAIEKSLPPSVPGVVYPVLTSWMAPCEMASHEMPALYLAFKHECEQN